MTLNSLLNRNKQLDSEILSLQRFIDRASDGKLIARKSSTGKYRYTVKVTTDDKISETYISENNMSLAESLALKEYCLARVKDLKSEKSLIESQLRNLKKESCEAKFFKQHPGIAELVLPRLTPPDQFAKEWAAAPYKRSNKYPEQLIYPSIIPDLMVRSKAEGDIVMRLQNYHVPLRYEEEHVINNIVLHPDFTCLNVRTREIFFIEHQGRWDDPKYVNDLRSREDLYLKAGIYPWVNLLITTETYDHPFDVKWFDKIIEHYLL